MATIDRAEVEHVARLARLALLDTETEQLTADLVRILDYVKKLDELDTTGVEPTAHAVALPPKLREDRAGDTLDVDEALQNAPERIGDGFGVPKIIE